MSILEWIKQPWPWYIAGPLIGVTIPTLLIMGNKFLGVSSSLRHICAACLPGKIPFFDYEWKAEVWNLFFVAGVVAGDPEIGAVAEPAPVRGNRPTYYSYYCARYLCAKNKHQSKISE